MKLSPPTTSPGEKVPPYALNKMFTANLFASAIKQQPDERIQNGITPDIKRDNIGTPQISGILTDYTKGKESHKLTYISPFKSNHRWSPNFNSFSKSPITLGHSGAFRALGFQNKSPFASNAKTPNSPHRDDKISPAKKLELTPGADN